jgi:hypothetical protein
MRIIERPDHFQFDNDRPLDQQIDIINPDDHPIVNNSDPMLLHDVQPTFPQLVHQRILANLLQKPPRPAYSKPEKRRQSPAR